MSAKSELGQTLRDGWRCGTREAELITETVADLDDEQSIEQETGKRTVHFIHGEFKRLEGTLPASVTWNWIVEERYDGDEAYLVITLDSQVNSTSSSLKRHECRSAGQ